METQVHLRTFLLLSALISCCGQLDGNSDCPVSPDQFEEKKKPLDAVIGGSVVLPCFPKFKINVADDIVEWGKGKKDIYVIDRNYIKHVDKDYKGRLQLSTEDLEKKNASLHLYNVKQSDEGRYCCCIQQTGKPTCTTVTLDMKKEGEGTSTERPGNLQIHPTEAPTKPPGGDTSDWIKRVAGGAGGGGGCVGVILAVLVFVWWKRCRSTDSRRGRNPTDLEETIEMTPADNGEQV